MIGALSATKPLAAAAAVLAATVALYGGAASACSPPPPTIAFFETDGVEPIGLAEGVLRDFAERIRRRNEPAACTVITLKAYSTSGEASDIGARRVAAVEAMLRRAGADAYAFRSTTEAASPDSAGPRDRRVTLETGRPAGALYECTPLQAAHPCGTRSCRVTLSDGTACGVEIR